MQRRSLNVKDYVKNATKNFSIKRLIIYFVVSLALTVLLLISIIKSQYEGKALIFSSFALILIAAYTIMNGIAVINKIKK